MNSNKSKINTRRALHYNYDIHGNVKSLLHDNPVLAAKSSSLANQRFKRLDYTYDLISGNVLQVSYQNGQPDAWHHRYEYDADNRITHAKTSTVPTPLESDWELDAHYLYYHHGSLARTELGEHTVQGIDYAYSLQGWLIATNSNTLQVSRDMGLDGSQALLPNGSENSNKNFARDAFSFSLGYYNGDYTPIDGSATFLADKTGSDLLANTTNLYNGNISSMVTTITTPVTFSPVPSFEILAQSNAYTYDRLNRLVESKSFANLDYSTNEWMNSGNPYDGRYHNQFTYNANGGMLTAFMKNALGEIIDNQTYHRPTVGGRYTQNRTYAITDAATQTSGEDLLDQQAFDNTVLANNNYDFTEIGERNKDNLAEIERITWNVYGKKTAIKRTAGSSKNNVKFDYDATNNRIAKHVYTSDDVWINSEYYVHDAQGNLMATYRLEASSGSGLSYKLTERHIYGSSSIGINTTPVEMIGVTPPTNIYPHQLGDKRFNGSNHLQNVLSVFTDKKLPLDIDNNGIIDGYLPQVISANDYAPFGSRLTERTFNKELYPNSFNGKRESAELDGEQDYGERDYNPKEREFDKDDPLITQGQKYPELSPYQFASNRPIDGVDLEGLEYATFTIIAHDGIVMDISVTTDYELKDKGTKGPGIQYNYIHLDENGKAKAEPTVNFVKNGFFDYGIYGGSTNPKLPEEGGKVNETKDYYGLAPIDEYDDKYKTHDKDFDKKDIAGIKGILSKKSTPANEKLVNALKEIKENKKAGGKDAITGNDYSKKGSGFGNRAKALFSFIEVFKKDAKKYNLETKKKNDK